MKKLLSIFFLFLFHSACFATDATYDVNKKELTLPYVIVGDTAYTFLTVQVDDVKVVDIGASNKVGGAGAPPKDCPDTLPKAKYDKIALGMTLEQVNQTLGCQYSAHFFPGSPDAGNNYGNFMVYSWWVGGNSLRSIFVAFDPRGKSVTSTGSLVATPNEPYFKWTLLDMTFTQ
ncbi:MAG: hypothetical protein WC091_15940 [Sulfuricellaceae bacterium]